MTVQIYDSVNQRYVDITPYIAFKGVKWQRADIDAEDAGRGVDGYMYRNRIGTKYRLDITCKPLKQSETQVILPLIKPQFVKVKYTDPELGERTDVWMYSNNIPASVEILSRTGVPLWSGITFPLIER